MDALSVVSNESPTSNGSFTSNGEVERRTVTCGSCGREVEAYVTDSMTEEKRCLRCSSVERRGKSGFSAAVA